MSWGGEALDAYVGASHVGLWLGRGALGWHHDAGGAEGLRAALKASPWRGRRWPRTALRIWLSATLARPLLVRPVEGLRNKLEAEAAVAAQAAGEWEGSGPLRVWSEASDPGRTTLAVVAPEQVLDAMVETAGASSLNVTSIGPWWSRALNEAIQGSASEFDGIAVADTEALTFLAGPANVWSEATSYQAEATRQEEHDIVRRRITALGLDAARVRRARLGTPNPQGVPTSLQAVIGAFGSTE